MVKPTAKVMAQQVEKRERESHVFSQGSPSALALLEFQEAGGAWEGAAPGHSAGRN